MKGDDIDVVKNALNMNLDWNEEVQNMSLAQLKLLDGKMEKHSRANGASDTAVRDYCLLVPEVSAIIYRSVPKVVLGMRKSCFWIAKKLLLSSRKSCF